MKNQKITISILIMLLGLFSSCDSNNGESGHPRLYTTNSEREAILQKIEEQDWAAKSWQTLLGEINPYVEKHQEDSMWIVSRLAMYWKEGKHYTQCYIKKQNWDYGEGNAPVPTVRLPGMRIWNDFSNVPLEDRIPFNESGDMLGISRSNPDTEPVLVPYKESGHMIRGNNAEILELAEKAAFAWWLTKDEKYARFASDIFQTWLMGTYYMKPAIDPDKSTGGKGGYEPGGIMGYYDYEQIHDDLQIYAASTYDFLYDYLDQHLAKALEETGKSLKDVASDVFKRFLDLGMVRGGKIGNWNVFCFHTTIRSMLVLEDNSYYEDGKGREYYLKFFTDSTTDYHEALPDILKVYDEVTGLWPESPGYATNTINSLLYTATPIFKNGIDVIAENPTIQKAALANLNWLDARGNLVNFGDGRGGHLDYSGIERLYSYYVWNNDERASVVASALKQGIDAGYYSRDNSGWVGLCLNEAIPSDTEGVQYKQSVWSEHHRHLIMRNGNSVDNGMMFTLYGGVKGDHLSGNGLALQLYGKGWALTPDASAYESYWSHDFGYHQSSTGANTIIPGYTHGEIKINAIDPKPEGFTNEYVTSDYCSFADFTAEEKRRVVAMIRTSPTTGYYVDIFRSDQEDNDYLQHVLGDKATITDMSGKAIDLKATNDLGITYNKNYSFFTNQRVIDYSNDFRVTWEVNKVSPSIKTEVWMIGQEGRKLYLVDAPATTLKSGVTPGDVNKSPQATQTLIVRQSKVNAFKNPFIAVFEAYDSNESSVKNISRVVQDDDKIALKVESEGNNVEYVLNSTNEELITLENEISFKGKFGVVSEKNGTLKYLYLGDGTEIENGGYRIESEESNVSATLEHENGRFYYSANKPVEISSPNGITKRVLAGSRKEIDFK